MSTQMPEALRKSIRSQIINNQLSSHFISSGSFQLIFPIFNPSCHLISCNIHKPSVSSKRSKPDLITSTPPPSMARESRQLHIDMKYLNQHGSSYFMAVIIKHINYLNNFIRHGSNYIGSDLRRFWGRPCGEFHATLTTSAPRSTLSS